LRRRWRSARPVPGPGAGRSRRDRAREEAGLVRRSRPPRAPRPAAATAIAGSRRGRAGLAGSPTIDAGLADSLIGATDLAGAPRSQPGCIGAAAAPDIGAYEFTPTAACPSAATLKPSSGFGFGKLKRNKHRGTASLAILVPGPGALTLSGKGLVSKHASAHGAEIVKLTVRARGKAAKKLRTEGKLNVRPLVTYIPTGGDPGSRSEKVKLIHRG
jgi:hypothetical protein